MSANPIVCNYPICFGSVLQVIDCQPAHIVVGAGSDIGKVGSHYSLSPLGECEANYSHNDDSYASLFPLISSFLILILSFFCDYLRHPLLRLIYVLLSSIIRFTSLQKQFSQMRFQGFVEFVLRLIYLLALLILLVITSRNLAAN